MALSLHAQLLSAALLLRLALLVYGELQDRFMSVKYTDVDYDVYSDAAREMAAGNSPFDRTTYRYTPVLYVRAIVSLWQPAARRFDAHCTCAGT